jgi:hypothetical protein
MARKRDEAIVAEAVRLYLGGMTRDEVAAELHVAGPTAGRWLKGVVRPRGARKLPDVTDEQVRELRDAGLSFRQMALDTGMSPTGVRNRYYAITGRPRGGASL